MAEALGLSFDAPDSANPRLKDAIGYSNVDRVRGDKAEDFTLFAYTVLQVEARRPGTIPAEVVEALGRLVNAERLSTAFLPDVTGESVEHIEELEQLLEQDTDVAKAIAYARVAELIENDRFGPEDIEAARTRIEADISAVARLTGIGR
jgi:hypothetical protein